MVIDGQQAGKDQNIEIEGLSGAGREGCGLKTGRYPAEIRAWRRFPIPVACPDRSTRPEG